MELTSTATKILNPLFFLAWGWVLGLVALRFTGFTGASGGTAITVGVLGMLLSKLLPPTWLQLPWTNTVYGVFLLPALLMACLAPGLYRLAYRYMERDES